MKYHFSVMLKESVNLLNCSSGKVIVDGTIGGFGHSKIICERIKPSGILLGIDKDIDAIKNAKKIVSCEKIEIHIRHENFISLPKIMKELGLSYVDGILIDIGLSLNQIKKSGRGFSFLKDEPLDMRMDINTGEPASSILNKLDEYQIKNILYKYGEIPWANSIARHIVKTRKNHPIKTSGQLVSLIKEAIPKRYIESSKNHYATKVFMALRIVTNNELDCLKKFLSQAIELLNPKGRLCVLSFHSLEDKIVKKIFKFFSKSCICPPKIPVCNCNFFQKIRYITKKVIYPSQNEIMVNPMSRSAKIRVVEKI